MANLISQPEEFGDHYPVMINEMIENLAPKDGGIYLDCTFGAGGYSRAILKSKNCMVVAFDQDPTVRKYADALKEEFPDRFIFLNANFADVLTQVNNSNELKDHKFLKDRYNPSQEAANLKFDGIVLDLGVSSMQLDTSERGFSFQADGHLDMRMGTGSLSAKDFINTATEQEIADVIFMYGEEHESRRIARLIEERRRNASIDTTLQLANIIREAKRNKYTKIDPATKSFQAIRIHINRELDALKTFLPHTRNLLSIGGRLIVVSFHSLEDTIVKAFMKLNAEEKLARSKYSKSPAPAQKDKWLKVINKKVFTPSIEEIKQNIRSRSAKMRVAEKLNNPREKRGSEK